MITRLKCGRFLDIGRFFHNGSKCVVGLRELTPN
jgi:hypothetical protein